MGNRNKKIANKYDKTRTKGNSKSKGKDVTEPEYAQGKGKNDISWYVSDEQILKDVARIPYSIPVGYPMSRNGDITTGLIDQSYDDAVPGIACMQVIPTIGNAQYAGDAVNVAANGIYTFVRHLNSGSRNYDAVDMIIYLMAVDSMYYVLSWATRLYATLSLYHQANRYIPDTLLLAQNVNYNDLREHMSEFRSRLNQKIRKISTLIIPKVLPIFERHSWLFSNYYIEGESMKDQIYLFTPANYYVFGYDSDGAGKLEPRTLKGSSSIGSHSGLLTADEIISVIDEMINPVFADEDFNIMSGDILKAYQGNIQVLGLVPDELPMSFSTNEAVLLQFKNAKVAPVRTESVTGETLAYKNTKFMNDMFQIHQSAGKSYVIVEQDQEALNVYHNFDGSGGTGSTTDLQKHALMQAYWNEWSKDTLLTSPRAEVEPAENMLSTRLTLAFDLEYDSDPDSPSGTKINEMYFGSEWPNYLAYWVKHRDRVSGAISQFSRAIRRNMIMSPDVTSAVPAATSYLPIRSAFKYAPEMSIIVDETTDPTDPQVYVSGRSMFELDNYTLVKSHVIGMLHNAAIQGEYNIPRVAMFAGK